MFPLGRGTKWTPPMPIPEASWAPNAAGRRAGISSAILVGRLPMSVASQRKSWRTECTTGVRRTLVPLSHRFFRTSCKTLNRPRPPGMASTIDRSSPRSFSHLLALARRWRGETESKRSNSRSTRCGGSSTVILMVSTTHPRMFFRVDHVASPLSIFLIDAGSWR
jgi:hypothetical protein